MAFTQTEELADRVQAKRKRLEARLQEARADTRKQGREAAEALQTHLDDLSELLSKGWNQVSEDVADKLNHWLSSEPSTPKAG
ncbi:MAG: hypothetical protein KDD82_20450 [Planctomycetes bacterium]|nr:hypothetical protein [Planctomycetota bacterium]